MTRSSAQASFDATVEQIDGIAVMQYRDSSESEMEASDGGHGDDEILQSADENAVLAVPRDAWIKCRECGVNHKVPEEVELSSLIPEWTCASMDPKMGWDQSLACNGRMKSSFVSRRKIIPRTLVKSRSTSGLKRQRPQSRAIASKRKKRNLSLSPRALLEDPCEDDESDSSVELDDLVCIAAKNKDLGLRLQRWTNLQEQLSECMNLVNDATVMLEKRTSQLAISLSQEDAA